MSEAGSDAIYNVVSLGSAGGPGEGGRMDQSSYDTMVCTVCHVMCGRVWRQGEELDRAQRACRLYQPGLYAGQACAREDRAFEILSCHSQCGPGTGGGRPDTASAGKE